MSETTPVTSFSLAGLRLDLLFEFEPEHDYPLHYREFLNGPGTPVARIRFTTSRPDALNRYQMISDMRAWTCGTADGHACVVHTGGPGRPPLWACLFEEGETLITMWCSDHLRRGVKTWNPFQFPMDQIIALFLLPRHERVLIHAAGMELNGRGFLFSGRSGAGKSTICRQLQHLSGGTLLSDDRIIVQCDPCGFVQWGTPWVGEAAIARNRSAPLDAVFFLRHAETNAAVRLTARQAMERLFVTASVPFFSEPLTQQTIALMDRLVTHVPFFELQCTPDAGVAKFIESFDPV